MLKFNTKKGDCQEMEPWMNAPEYPPCRVCAECHDDVTDEEPMYEIHPGYHVCESCFKNFIEESYEPTALAVILGIHFQKRNE